MSNRSLMKGTIEYVVVEMRDRLHEVTNIGALNPTFDVISEDGVDVVSDAVPDTEDMLVKCLIDTTGVDWTVREYDLYVNLQAAPESPKVGPARFRVHD